MIPTIILETAAGELARKSYQPPAASRAILGPIINLIKSDEARALFPFYDARIICKLPGGQIYYESQLAVDTDGSRFAKQDHKGQGRTAWQPGRQPVDADSVSYFSVNIPVFHDSRFGLRKGDVAAVIYQNKLVFAVLADVGGRRLGEGSLALHRELGHERVRNRGSRQERFIDSGIPSGVITIAFPHSGNPGSAALTAQGALRARGQALWWDLLASTGGDFPTPSSMARPT